jgi:hypothetical protein
MMVSMRSRYHRVVGHIQLLRTFINGKRPGEMDKVEGGIGRFLAKADQDFVGD